MRRIKTGWILLMISICVLFCGAALADNELEAYVDGQDGQNDSITLNCSPGESVTMKVAVSAVDMTGITYEWMQAEYDLDAGTWGDYQTISGADSDTFAVDSLSDTERYICRVQDQYGNTKDVSFELYLENGFSVAIYGNYYSLKPAESTILSFYESADSGTFDYQWFLNDERIEGAKESTYTVSACTGQDYYQCRIINCHNTQWVGFNVRFDNELTVKAAGDSRPKVQPGSDVTMQVAASFNAGGIHYQWYSYSDRNGWEIIADATDPVLTREEISYYSQFRCSVTDDYGNSREVNFYVTVDNGFVLRASGLTNLKVRPGESVTMAVDAFVNSGSVRYEWSCSEETLNGDTTAASYTYAGTAAKRTIQCTAEDDYGNSDKVSFQVDIDSGFTAKALTISPICVEPGEQATLQVKASVEIGSLSYQWYHGGEMIPSAETDTYIVENPRRDNYICRITDDYGHEEEIRFVTVVDNDLRAEPADGISVIDIVPGEPLTLRVDASAKQGPLTYTWRWGTPIEGEEGATYTVNDPSRYKGIPCTVSDAYGNSKDITFAFQLPGAASVQAEADGPTMFDLNPGDSAELRVKGTGGQGSLIYEWSKHPVYQSLQWETLDADSDCFTAESIRESAIYSCRVTDENSTGSTNVDFTVLVNHFSIRVPGDYESKYVRADMNNHTEYKKTVPFDSSLQIVLEAECDQGPIHYSWSPESSDSNVFSLAHVRKNESVLCTVSDDYGNREILAFKIMVENQLSVLSASNMVQIVPKGGNATLFVEAACTNGEPTYNWTYGGARYYNVSQISHESSITLQNIQTGSRYTCTVKDPYGNSQELQFMILVEEEIAEAGLNHWTRLITMNPFPLNAISFMPESSGMYRFRTRSSVSYESYMFLTDADMNLISDYDWASSPEVDVIDAFLNGGTKYYLAQYSREGYSLPFEIQVTKLNNTLSGSMLLLTGQMVKVPAPADAGDFIGAEAGNPDVISVSGDTFTAAGSGTTTMNLTYENLEISYTVEVLSEESGLSLPMALQTIGEEAFQDAQSARFVTLGPSVEDVQGGAFASSGLRQIVVNGMSTTFDSNAFGDLHPQIICPAGSEAEAFALLNGYDYLYLP